MQLVLVLYGEGCVAQHSLVLLQRHAETYGFIMLAPTSMEQTWDIIARRRYGIDSTEIDDLLDTAFDRHIVDPARLAIAVFSGRSIYALSLGLTNGELFSHVIAFSPGFMAPSQPHGTPAIHMSHGIDDEVLPIDQCSHRIEGQLRAAGYALDYRELAGCHLVPDTIATTFFSALARENEARSR